MISIDWQETARKKGRLTKVLRLFACRLAWLRHGDAKAHDALLLAAKDADPEIRTIAASFLSPVSNPASAEAPRFDPREVRS